MPDWLDSITAADWLNATVNGLGIFIAFVAGAVVGPWLNAKRARVEAKERVLRTLLNTRLDVGHPDFSAAISITPLEFASSRPVRSAHAKYLAATNLLPNNDGEKAAYNIERANRLDDLISSMAADLGLDVTGHEGSKYLSGAYVERSQLQEDSWLALIRIANTLERAEAKALPPPGDAPPPAPRE